jgi:hypothetical protein
MYSLRKVLLYVTTPLVILYCVSVLYYVQTSWDLGVRGLFANSATIHDAGPGTVIGRAIDAVVAAGPAPQSGDILYRIAGADVPSALHITPRLTEIAPPDPKPGLVRLTGPDQLASQPPSTVIADIDTQRWARVEFFSEGQRSQTACS